ncbi:hypothetical protein [Paludibacterium purpuratum]|uniref:Uncharacterized protein n=1 Tax=Paludibacterium purpuratum TaxID=1144873 RepID=A0A4R7B8Q2_9NEIS|nr:hypothetical protein [Paludibacterium purpuratum]TDR80106.1 hypothetical protein DFP86_106249 [Paludibacterium purpuratum]
MTSIQKKMALCKQCKSKVPSGANICSICNNYQDWRRFIPISNTVLALLTALVSVIAIAVPSIYKIVHKPRSEAVLMMPSVDGTTLRVVAVNRGDAPASLAKAWVDSQYLAAATKIRLRNDSQAIINPGSQLLVFDIIPLLDEADSYRSSLEILGTLIKNKPTPRTEIRFLVMQSDGRSAVQAILLDSEQLFSLLRANSDRCSAIKIVNFENGCIGSGSPLK